MATSKNVGRFGKKCASRQLHEDWGIKEDNLELTNVSKMNKDVVRKLCNLCNISLNRYSSVPHFCSACIRKVNEEHCLPFKVPRIDESMTYIGTSLYLNLSKIELFDFSILSCEQCEKLAFYLGKN